MVVQKTIYYNEYDLFIVLQTNLAVFNSNVVLTGEVVTVHHPVTQREINVTCKITLLRTRDNR